MFSRLQNSNEIITLNDDTLANELYNNRQKANEYASKDKRKKKESNYRTYKFIL